MFRVSSSVQPDDAALEGSTAVSLGVVMAAVGDTEAVGDVLLCGGEEQDSVKASNNAIIMNIINLRIKNTPVDKTLSIVLFHLTSVPLF
jgi:hypothetical protein